MFGQRRPDVGVVNILVKRGWKFVEQDAVHNYVFSRYSFTD